MRLAAAVARVVRTYEQRTSPLVVEQTELALSVAGLAVRGELPAAPRGGTLAIATPIEVAWRVAAQVPALVCSDVDEDEVSHSCSAWDLMSACEALDLHRSGGESWQRWADFFHGVAQDAANDAEFEQTHPTGSEPRSELAAKGDAN